MVGKLSEKMLDSLLETIPIEFSLVDENNKVLAWNRHETRVFKRPTAVLGKDVRDCHPKKSLDKVEVILSEMKHGKRESAEFWIDMELDGKPEKIYIQYLALRGENGEYLGCLEASQKISRLQSLEGEKRLLD
jgi:PAS domain S-box-containing protein